MNSSGVWLRDNNSTKQLPTPVILPETFVEHKKTLLNCSCGIVKQSSGGSAIVECAHHRYTSSATLLKSRTAIAPRCCALTRNTPTNTNLLPGMRSSVVENRFFDGKFANSTPPPPSSTLSSSSLGVQPNHNNNVAETNTSCNTHCMLHRHWNNFSQIGGGGSSSLNTPFASRSMPYKRFKDFNYTTGPINLSKNGNLRKYILLY